MFSPLRNSIERFVKLSDDEWNLLVPHLAIRQLKKHELLVKEGKLATEFCFVLEGMLRHYYLLDGEERTTYFYFENHFVAAYFSCITKQPSRLSIEAISDCRLITFPYSILEQLYHESLTWQKFGRLVAEYLAFGLEERMVGLLMLSPEERYLELVSGNKIKIIERIPQHYIANYLGITPVSLSRIRARVIKK